ncbi:MAG: hypothetical protein ACRDJU_12860 [Actinomycetota bacterium]
MSNVSETYTAVYARDGENWSAEITGRPGLQGHGGSLAEVRQQIRQVLASDLSTAPESLNIVDTIKGPARYQADRKQVSETRTEAEKTRMWNNMTDHKTVDEWVEELDLANREPGALKWLKQYEGVTLGIDQLCHTITLAEEIARWGEVDMDEAVAEAAAEPKPVSETH